MSAGALLASPVQSVNFPLGVEMILALAQFPLATQGPQVPSVASLDVPLLAALLCATTSSLPGSCHPTAPHLRVVTAPGSVYRCHGARDSHKKS